MTRMVFTIAALASAIAFSSAADARSRGRHHGGHHGWHGGGYHFGNGFRHPASRDPCVKWSYTFNRWVNVCG